ncbi:MAG: CRTAC1 family protein [Myxococcales bacterium]|nr:CRTAC1 family protein [Myxococcales bacterium]
MYRPFSTSTTTRCTVSAWATALLAAAVSACDADADATPETGGTLFVDGTERAGIVHRVEFGDDPALPQMARNLGAGVIAEDLDGDGHIDLYFTNAAGTASLWWNRGDGTFERGDVAPLAPDGTWGVAAGAADIDNDGDRDVLLVNRGPDRLLLNEGGRRFTDASDRLGGTLDGTGLGVQFGDLDGDGRLDLFVGGTSVGDAAIVLDDGDASDDVFVQWGKAPSHLLWAEPDGSYLDVTSRVGATGLPEGNAFNGAMLDLDADGDLDLYVTQDTQGEVLNLLYRNDGAAEDGFVTLTDVSASCNCQSPQAAMGLGVLDIDANGLPELYVSNLIYAWPNREALLFNRGDLVFQDVTEATGAASMDGWTSIPVPSAASARAVSWGITTLDVQNDTLEDLFVVYGELATDLAERPGSEPNPLFLAGQPDALIRARGDGHFETLADSGLEDRGRGQAAVAADFDGDGCEDVVVVNLDGPTRLYRARCDSVGTWIALDLQGTRSNRDAIGARVKIEAGGRTQWRYVHGCATSAHSCTPKRVHVGLGGAKRVDRVTIHWPAGGTQVVSNLDVNRRHAVIEATSRETPAR